MDPFNGRLLCLRARTFFKLSSWERTIEDCDRALEVRRRYPEVTVLRASTYIKLERWAEAVIDYKRLRDQFPDDEDVAQALFYAEASLKEQNEEVVLWGNPLKKEFKSAAEEALTIRPGVSVVLYMKCSEETSSELSLHFDAFCICYPSVEFRKVEVGTSNGEDKQEVPTVCIFEKGSVILKLFNPSKQEVEDALKLLVA